MTPIAATHRLPATTHLGQVHLSVSDLPKMLDFYTRVIGLTKLRGDSVSASLGVAGRELLRLSLKPGSRHYEDRCGLYHFCLLTPQRLELGRLLRRLADAKTPLQGLVDHRTSEAIYLPDPEGNGIELNWDREAASWPANMSEMMRLGNAPLDTEGLLALADAAGPGDGLLPADATLAHIHLHVADLAPARHFYHDLLGFDIMGEFRGAAVFTSAGGYHHHIAFNIWAGHGAPTPPKDASGLLWFSVILPDQASLNEALTRLKDGGVAYEQGTEGYLARDPSGNGVLLSAGSLARP